MRRPDHPYLGRLREAPLFASCSRRDLAWLAERAQPLRVRVGDLLMLEHYHGEVFLLLVDGAASIRRGGVEIAEVGPGDFIGEVGLLDRADRSATVVATSPVSALYWDQDAFDQILLRMPAVATRIREVAGQRRVTRQPG